MQHARRLTCRRRAGPPTRLVGQRRERSELLTVETISGYEIGMAAARRLASMFPIFYKQHVAGRKVCPATLCGAADAFLKLVDKIVPCYEPVHLWAPGGPVEVLDHYVDDDPDDCLEWLTYVADHLDQPQVIVYGVGAESVYDADQEYSLLTLALWHMASGTDWSLGLALGPVLRAHMENADGAYSMDLITCLPHVPPATSLARLCTVLDREQLYGMRVGELFAYAFSRCDTPLANVTSYELETIYGGQMDVSWNDDLAELGKQAREARAIEYAYTAWSHQVESDPTNELTAVWERIETAIEMLEEVEYAPVLA